MEINLHLRKFFFVISAASLTTLLVFFVMYRLIASEIERSPITERVRITIPTMQPVREREKLPQRRKPIKTLPAELPPMPNANLSIHKKVQVLTRAAIPSLDAIENLLEIEPYIPAPLRDLTPMLVIHPNYPFTAAMREIEGFVLVRFSVRENGTVKNPVVVNSEPGSIFDEAALSAVSKFKFYPRLVSGAPMAVENIQIKFAFRLDSPYVDYETL